MNISEKEYRIWKELGIYFIALYVFSLIFDFLISYLQYRTNPSFFLEHEANIYLVFDLQNGQFFFFSIPVVIQFFLIYFMITYFFITLCTIYIGVNQKRITLGFFLVFVFMLSIFHFVGGLSWVFR